MSKRRIALFLLIAVLVFAQKPATAQMSPGERESNELMFQDMLMLFLLPHIEKKINVIYSNKLNGSPTVYPYFVDVTQVKRHLKDPQKADFPPNYMDILKK